MAEQVVAEMTVAELEALIESIIEKKYAMPFKRHGPRSFEEVYESIERNRWTPQPGSPSMLELLREDRDR